MKIQNDSIGHWDVSTAVYSGKSFYIGAQSPYGSSVRSKPDGLIMYIVDCIYITIYQYTLSIAWDITTAVYSGKFLDVGKQDDNPQDISFNLDGSIMYMLGSNNVTVFQYDLIGKKHTPWDVSSAVYNRIKLDVSAQNYYPTGLRFSSDGTKLYTLDTLNDTVYQYNLSVPWDITSGLYSGKSFRTGDPNFSPKNMAFSSDGTKLYTVNTATLTVYQYTLSIPWDLSTASYSNKFVYIGDQATIAYGISFSILGSEMYILGVATDTVYQYTLGNLINGYFMSNGAREEKSGYFMNSVEEFGYYMNPKT